MKLTRTVHMGGVQVFYDEAARLLPDVQVIAQEQDGEAVVADRVLLFVDVGAGEAHGFMFSEAQALELAKLIAAPRVEIARTFPGGLLSKNGDGA